MSIGYVLTQVGNKVGLNPNEPIEREVLLRFVNEAAEELYDQSDPPGSLMEQPFKVNGDQTISCPYYVGEIRGAREIDSQIVWEIHQLRPRYNQFNWIDLWRNLRLKNTQALMSTMTNQSIGIITVDTVETPPIVVTVSGPTTVSAMSSESIVMDQVKKFTSLTYLDFVAVKKDRVNNYDVTLSDVDHKLLTIIPSNQLDAFYQIIDVSTCPWLQTGLNPLEHYLEILYKKALPWFENDSDEYPAPKHDNILVNKCLQLWNEEQSNDKIAMLYDTKATRSLARKAENRNKATLDTVALVANPHDNLCAKVRTGRRIRGYRY